MRNFSSACRAADDWYVEWWDAAQDQYWYEPVIGFTYTDYFEETDYDFRHYMTAIAMGLDGESYVVRPVRESVVQKESMQCLRVFKDVGFTISLYRFIDPQFRFLPNTEGQIDE